MKQLYILKLVFRGWWRNKLFTLISILSLAIGIACTNLLLTYVIYETNIESSNPERDKIIYMSQDSPFEAGKRVSFVVEGVPQAIKDRHPEVENYLHLADESVLSVHTAKDQFGSMILLGVSSEFTDFFSYPLVHGDLNSVLNTPGKVALKERTAQRLYGDENPIGRQITVQYEWEGSRTYEIAAVIKDYDQSFLKFDILTRNPDGFYGGVALLKTAPGTDNAKLLEKINADSGITRLNMETGKYYFSTLQQASFDSFRHETLNCIHHGQKNLISIGFISAILILLIACFNYANLLLSRILQQVRLIQVERLMGAGMSDIRMQLFADAFLTVLISFLISLLLMHDFLHIFNSVMESSLSTGFFFTSRVLWILVLFVLILSFVPALFISSRLSRLTETAYRNNFTGRKKNLVISFMVVFQFMISIGLVVSTITVRAQLNQTAQRGDRYKNIIEIGTYDRTLPPEFIQEAAWLTGIVSMTAGTNSTLSSGVREIAVVGDDGTKIPWALELYDGDKHYLETFSIGQLAGDSIDEIVTRYPVSVLVNETFVNSIVPEGVNPVGRLWKDFDEWGDSLLYITGIVEDFQVLSSDIRIRPAVIFIRNDNTRDYSYLHIKLDGRTNQNTVGQLEKLWKQLGLEGSFIWHDTYSQFMERNKSVTNLSNLLSIYAGISLMLTCLGLIGITLYSVRQREREIAIRKINGASAWQIISLLLKPFLAQILISSSIALPIVWWLLARWLEQFVYRDGINLPALAASLIGIVLVSGSMVVLAVWRVIRSNPVKVLKGND